MRQATIDTSFTLQFLHTLRGRQRAARLGSWLAIFGMLTMACGDPGNDRHDDEPSADESTITDDVGDDQLEDINVSPLSSDESHQAEEIAQALSIIESIPADIAEQGEDATRVWLEEQQASMVIGKSTASCALALGKAIVLNFPVFKIFKLKRIINALGGAPKLATAVVKIYKQQRAHGHSRKTALERAVKIASRRAGPEAKVLLVQLFSLGGVFAYCFD